MKKRNVYKLLPFKMANWFKTIMNVMVLVIVLNAQNVTAQNRTVSGKVVDENNVPLPGASVVLKNTTVGTTTDFDGNFEITIADTNNQTLQFSYVGYLQQEVDVAGKAIINVALRPDISALDEVVVVGYGTQKRESLTAAVSVIENREIQTTTNVSVAQKLTGKIPGVQIRQQSGQPGDFDNSINIRGFGEPLYVIDGIRRGGSRDFQQLNADDIESITVLKDAAASIYGLGAQNGVILVTTKRGKKGGKLSFNFNTVYSVVSPTDVPEMATAAQYAQMWNDTQLFIPGGSGVPFYSPEELQNWVDGAPGFENTDWYDLTIRNNTSTVQHNLSASGGTEKTNYFMSFGYVNEDGLLRSNDMGYERYNIRLNVSTELAKNVTATALLSGRWDKRWQPGENFFNIFKGTRVALPVESAYANGNQDFLAAISGTVRNPLALSERDITGYNDRWTRRFTSQFSVEYKAPFLSGLTLKAVLAYDADNFQEKVYSPSYDVFTYDETAEDYIPQTQRDGNASIFSGNNNSDYTSLQGYLMYEKSLNDAHNFSITGVVEKNSLEGRFANVRRFYNDPFQIDQLRFATATDPVPQIDGIDRQTADFSIIGRFNYDYKGKYLLELSARDNGSYRYAPESRYGLFGYGSVGWRVSEEGFIKNNIDWISNLKLRASYGIVGEPEGDPFQYVQGYAVNSGGSFEFEDGILTQGIRTPPPPNANLSWLENTTSNFAIDLGLFQNRLNFTAEYYERLREGIPARPSVALPNTFGGVLPQENLNSEITKGLDFSISYRDRIGQDFSFDIAANFNLARTKRKHVEGNGPFTNSMSQWRNQRFDRWNDIVWGYNYIGQFQNVEELRNAPLQNGDRSNVLRELPGDFRYEDWNNDGVIDNQDTQPIFWGGNPKMFYGMTINMAYKGFYMNMLLQGAANYTVRFRETYAEMFAFRGNTPAYFFDRWRKEDPFDINSAWVPGTWPASRTIGDVGGIYRESSVWRRDASYLRMKSLEIGYNLKNDDLQKALGINNLRIYVSGFNLVTWADDFVKPFDPEKIEGAFSAGLTYPLTKTYNFGVNIDF
jgi:TonB-linked SusC/RagA family outer membrane protein